jgi:hypothetical protein
LIGEEVIRKGCSKLARQFAKQGCPESSRSQIWDLCLQSDRFNKYSNTVDKVVHILRSRVAHFDLLIDHLILVDSKHCQNHENYFVFEEKLCEMLLYWSRDTWISQNLPESSLNEMGADKNGSALNNVLPFWGISLYAMPVCYLHLDSGYSYMTFRELYVR